MITTIMIVKLMAIFVFNEQLTDCMRIAFKILSQRKPTVILWKKEEKKEIRNQKEKRNE